MSRLCPFLCGGITIAIKGYYRTTVYLVPDLHARARSDELNLSEILNQTLAAIYGVEYRSEKQILMGKIPGVAEEVKNRIKQEQRMMEQEQSNAEAKQAEQEQIAAAIWRALGGLGAVAFGRLPEFDRNGDYYEFWDRTAAAVSRAAGCPVSTVQVQEVVRRGRK